MAGAFACDFSVAFDNDCHDIVLSCAVVEVEPYFTATLVIEPYMLGSVVVEPYFTSTVEVASC